MSEETIDIMLDLQVTDESVSKLRQIEGLAGRTLGLFRRLGLPENIDNAITKLQRIIFTMRMLTVAAQAVQAALIPGAGWLKLARAAVSVGTVAVSAYDLTRGDL